MTGATADNAMVGPQFIAVAFFSAGQMLCMKKILGK